MADSILLTMASCFLTKDAWLQSSLRRAGLAYAQQHALLSPATAPHLCVLRLRPMGTFPLASSFSVRQLRL